MAEARKHRRPRSAYDTVARAFFRRRLRFDHANKKPGAMAGFFVNFFFRFWLGFAATCQPDQAEQTAAE
jgi:hypothetical protein